MKIRNGFVSNSSSSSFTIRLDDITARQLKLINSHKVDGPKIICEGDYELSDEDTWIIYESDFLVEGSTWMYNFDMSKYLRAIGVPDGVIKWSE